MKQHDLFSQPSSQPAASLPLALRMTPRTLDEFMGQEKILAPGTLLRRTIEADRVSSLIVFGPSGTGKSALARIIAGTTRAHFAETNAVLIGVSDIRRIIDEAKLRLQTSGTKTTLLLDEIHHFNRSQQDALLPDVERGVITLIGITTENPYFYINNALLSRSLLFEFTRLSETDLSRIIDAALGDPERGLGKFKVALSADAREHLISHANGDARRLLNALEVGVLSTPAGDKGVVFDLAVAEASLQKKALSYDKKGDEHYDHASAFIKSMRGSDPDAALYWMAKMLAAGEDPRFIARRMVIFASEDVGNADPHAMLVAGEALRAVEFVGMPEGKIPLAHAVTYVACAPKSNAAYRALHKAEEDVRSGKPRPVPDHLKDSNLDGPGRRDHGAGYRYPHDYPGHFVAQDYGVGETIFYEPSDQGYEGKIRERLSAWRREAQAARPVPQRKKQSSR